MNQLEKDKLTDLVNQMMAVIRAEQIPAILQPDPTPAPVQQPEVKKPGFFDTFFGNNAEITATASMDGSRCIIPTFGKDMTAIVALPVPTTHVSGSNTIAIFEYAGPQTDRRAWLSKTKGDMSATTAPHYITNSGPVFNYTINGNDPNSVNMKPGETWYLMIRNESVSYFGGAISSSCSSGDCPIAIKWYPPNN